MNVKELYGNIRAAVEDMDHGLLVLTWIAVHSHQFKALPQHEKDGFFEHLRAQYPPMKTVQPKILFPKNEDVIFSERSELMPIVPEDREPSPETHVLIGELDIDDMKDSLNRLLYYMGKPDELRGEWNPGSILAEESLDFISLSDNVWPLIDLDTVSSFVPKIKETKLVTKAMFSAMKRCGLMFAHHKHDTQSAKALFAHLQDKRGYNAPPTPRSYWNFCDAFTERLLHLNGVQTPEGFGMTFVSDSRSALKKLIPVKDTRYYYHSPEDPETLHLEILKSLTSESPAAEITGFYIPRLQALLPFHRQDFVK